MYLSFHLLWLLDCCEHCFHFSPWANAPLAWSLFTLDCNFLKCSEYLFHFSPKKDSSLLYISQCKYYSPNMASISHLEHAICMNLSPRDFPFWTPKPFTTSLTKTFFLTQDTFFFFFLVLLENYFWALLKHFPHPRKNTTCTSAPNLKSLTWTYYSFEVILTLRCIILLLMKNILANIHVNFISPSPQKLNKISTWISFFALKRNAKQFECAFGFPFFNVVADKKREILTKFMILIWKGENLP